MLGPEKAWGAGELTRWHPVPSVALGWICDSLPVQPTFAEQRGN